MVTSLPPRILSGTLVSTLGRAVGTAISVVTIGVLTRGLSAVGGVAAYGSYAAVFAFLAVVAVVADGGLYLVFTRAAAREPAAERALFGNIVRIRLWTLLVTAGAIAMVAAVLPYPSSVRQGILLGALGIFCQLVSQLTMGVYQKRLRMLTPTLADVGGRLTTLLLAVVAAVTFQGILAYVGAFVVGAVVTLVWNLVGVRRLLDGSPPAEIGRGPSSREIFREALPLGLMLVFWLMVFRADSLLLSVLRPPEDLGWYALPYKVLESLLFFPAMIGGLLFPTLSRVAASVRREEELGSPFPPAGADPTSSGRRPTERAGFSERSAEHFTQTLDAATRLFLGLAIPIVLLLHLSAPLVIAMLGGPSFAPSVPVLRILSVALGALFFGNLYGNSAIALGAQRPLLAVAVLLAAANVGVNMLVIPRYSFMGAAWTTLGTEVLSACLAAGIVVRRVPHFAVSPGVWHILRAGGVFLFFMFLPLPPAVRAGFGLLGYVGCLALLGVVRVRDLLFLLRAQRLPRASV